MIAPPTARILSVVHEQTGLDALYIYKKLPLVCVYAFEHVWLTKQGVDCVWLGQETEQDLINDLLTP